VGFHGLFCRLLEAEAVPYVVLGAEVAGREERVRFVVGKWRECAARVLGRDLRGLDGALGELGCGR
jgi:hypothetical protein